MTTSNVSVYFEDDGNRQVFASGGEQVFENGARQIYELTYPALESAGMFARLTLFGTTYTYGFPVGATFSPAPTGTDECTVTITLIGADDATALLSDSPITVWLSDSASGGATATAPDGGLTVGGTGELIATLNSGKALLIAPVGGVAEIVITDSATTGYYVRVSTSMGFPFNTYTSAALEASDYNA